MAKTILIGENMNFWFWVAKKEAVIGQEGWWGDCGPSVKPGDVSLIYHKSPKSYIEELALITSKPKPNCPIETQKGLTIYGHCCKYEIIHEFIYPLSYREMKVNSILSDWISSNSNLQGMYFSVDDLNWSLIEERLKEKNNDYKGHEALV